MDADVNHFSMVGFPIELRDEAAVNVGVNRWLETCRDLALDKDDRVCVIVDPSGGEVRLGLRDRRGETELITLNPAFDGEGRVPVEIQQDVSDREWKPFEPAVLARFAGEETPLVFDLSAPEQAGKAEPGAKITVEIAAFSFDPAVFADEAAYYADQKKTDPEGMMFSSNHFIPIGMFKESMGGVMAEGSERPEPYAMFAGKVLKAELRSNATGGGKFWWALVETYGGTVDVVLDPRTVEAEPKPGAVISGSFWLSARVVED